MGYLGDICLLFCDCGKPFKVCDCQYLRKFNNCTRQIVVMSGSSLNVLAMQHHLPGISGKTKKRICTHWTLFKYWDIRQRLVQSPAFRDEVHQSALNNVDPETFDTRSKLRQWLRKNIKRIRIRFRRQNRGIFWQVGNDVLMAN